jgi:hypothetical protein
MDEQEKQFIVGLARSTYDRVVEEAVNQYRQARTLQAALAASRQKLKVKELALDYIAEKDMGLVMWAHNRASINAADQQD